jgi:hypothetical protein
MLSCKSFSQRPEPCRFLKLVVAGLLLVVLPLLSQTFFGSILGTVTDSSGSPIPAATVTLTNVDTGERHSMETSETGDYRFINFVPGNYRVDIEKTGFKRYGRDQVKVEVEGAIRIDAAMQLGDLTQSIEVNAQTPLLQTENATQGQVVQGRSIQELPLNGRNVLNLVALAPGVVPQGNSMTPLTGQNVFSAGNYQIGGGTANQSATLFDGVPVNTNYGNAVVLVPSQDVVQEFRVQTNNNTAEYGAFTGGVINIASKSGGNDFHGSTYEFLRNRVLNATDFFTNANSQPKPAFTQNQFGVTFGGPIRKDKTFFFAGYEGYRQRYGRMYFVTVPTLKNLNGDFSDIHNSSGATVPIYDPLTQCGQYSNPACTSSTVQRAPFPNNIIPANRINPVSSKLLGYPLYAQPNIPGNPLTQQFNFSKNATTGGDYNQWNIRGDHSVSEKQRIFARFTRWDSTNAPADPYGNGLYAGDPVSPEAFITHQAVLGDTYTFSPTLVGDFRIAYMRWFYNRTPQSKVGLPLASMFGLPSYFDQIPTLDGLENINVVPRINASGYSVGGTGLLRAANNTYVITPTLTWINGRHTLKFGADLRRQDVNYFQNNTPSGNFNFDPGFTARNGISPGATGNSFASFLLGYPSATNASQVQIAPLTAGSMRYQGYFVNDSLQLTNKLTINAGVRWEIPGVYTERYDRLATFDQTMVNPALQGITINGAPVPGAFVLVNTRDHPSRGLRPEKFGLFAPRLGIAYRLNDKTVIRTGAGIFYIPATVKFEEGPYANPVNNIQNVMVSSINGGVTPLNTLSNPFPNGFIAAPGRDPSFQRLLLGGSSRAPRQYERYGYTGQWNFAIQHEFIGGITFEAAYAGLRGVHLPINDYQMNQLPDQYLALGSQLMAQVPNPFYGSIANGALSQRTVQQQLLLRPFPEYTSVPNPTGRFGVSSYHALQLKAEKRFGAGGTVLGTYTFSKVLSDVESNTSGWLDSATGVGGIQNNNNLNLEKSQSSFDVHQRFVLSYVVDLPFGKGQKFLSGVHGFTDKVVSGWGVNGVTTLQMGFPLALTASPNSYIFGGGLRPNVVPGCDAVKSGATQDRLLAYFDTSCFSFPTPYTYGTESRTDPRLRGPGIANWDFALFKKTPITERFNLEFRAEIFNLFNRVQFGTPDRTFTTNANSTFGRITTQANNPRLIQLALRLAF